MNKKFHLSLLPLFFLFFLVLVGCGGDQQPLVELPTVTPAAINVPEGGGEAAPAEPTLTQAPTLPPPVVASPAPTAASETVAEEREEGDGQAAISLLTAADFGSDRNRLTGELVEDPAVLQRRPLAIKISNAPARWVRPQSGLNAADIVFEHITEGALTRFTMLMYANSPEKVGPIRSARLIDVELPAMYDAALVFSGASVGVSRRLYRSDFASRIVASGAEGYYRTGENKPYEHTLYAQPAGLWRALDTLGENRPPALNQVLAFSSIPPAGGEPASEITLDFRWEKVTWTYDPTTNYYYRTADGQPHLDGNTGEQVRARNIVVPFANHVDNAEICEEIRDNRCVALSVEIQLWTNGPVVIFRDGQRFEGTWRRDGRNDMLSFYDDSGRPLPLQLGNSWFELMSFAYPPLEVTP